MEIFEELPPECNATVTVTTFRYKEKVFTVSTTEIMSLKVAQTMMDLQAGYKGKLGNYETMLFINQDSLVYPFGDLPGCIGLGVFQRYDTEGEARDGHFDFLMQVQRTLRSHDNH